MPITYEDIRKANETIQTTTLDTKKGAKEYAEVNQRIKAFRMVYPTGAIMTEMLSNENGVCVFRATVFADSGSTMPLSTGTAYEKEGSTFINKTSYIENCETSAVGRALGMAGFGIDTSVASAEEVANAIANQHQDDFATEEQVEFLKAYYTGDKLKTLLDKNDIIRIEDIAYLKAEALIKKIQEKESKQ